MSPCRQKTGTSEASNTRGKSYGKMLTTKSTGRKIAAQLIEYFGGIRKFTSPPVIQAVIIYEKIASHKIA